MFNIKMKKVDNTIKMKDMETGQVGLIVGYDGEKGHCNKNVIGSIVIKKHNDCLSVVIPSEYNMDTAIFGYHLYNQNYLIQLVKNVNVEIEM